MKIELCNVDVGYEKHVILDGINLTFESGHFYCILGSNGIGKTTLFKSILNFIPAIGGTLTVNDKLIDELGPAELSEYLSYVPQAKDSSYNMNVLEVVVMGRARFVPKFSQPSDFDYEIARKMMERLKIEKLINKKYTELSGGEQQIVLIARALVQESTFIIMDEPASNLDFQNQKKVLDCLKELAADGFGIVLTSHSPDHAFYCGCEVVLIDKDKRISVGSCQDALTDEKLKAVYGVDIHVLKEIIQDGKEVSSCCLVN